MKIAILGYGKMGKAITRLAQPKHTIALRIGSEHAEGLDSTVLKQCDVAIEFSTPESAFNNIKTCLEAGIPVVSGTTGWLEKMTEIEKLVKENDGTFFYAANFSLGVNLFFAINKFTAELMARFPGYQASMEEVHHVHKKDAPSGTAIRLAQDIIQPHPQLNHWSLDEQSDTSLQINAIREGEVTGTHHIRYHSNEDVLSLSHEALTRDSFARGALLAAEWVIGKKGMLGMKDMLDL